MTTVDRDTYCPYCDSKILPGKSVIGVDHEDPFRSLWHTECRSIWWNKQDKQDHVDALAKAMESHPRLTLPIKRFR